MVDSTLLADNQSAFLPSSQLGEDSVVQHWQVAPALKPPDKKKLLIILHGKRIDDDFVRGAIDQIRAEGHEVRVVEEQLNSCWGH